MIEKTLLLFLLFSGFLFAQSTSTGVQVLKGDLSVDITTNETTTILTITGPSNAWFAVGFDDYAIDMSSSTDVFRTDGTTIVDAQTAGNQLPPADESQDWTMISNTIDGNVRTIVASRDNDTGDISDYVFSNTAGSIDLIWAYGTSVNYGYHVEANRGATTVGVTLGTTDVTNLDFDLFPNPASNGITLQLPVGLDIANVSLYDFSGRKVRENSVSLVNNFFDLEGLVNGVYILKVSSSDMIGIKRIIKR